MPTFGNKRVTQLVELTANQVDPGDWFLIIDNTARESKKIQASELSAWLNASGSLYAIHADNADTASYILAANVDCLSGPVLSASYALSASWAPAAGLTPGGTYPITSSWSISASWAPGGNAQLVSGSTYNITASWATRASAANISNTSSYLWYQGGNNGTASYALTASNAQHVVNADTASYFNNVSSSVASASYAVHADTASYVEGGTITSASFLVYSPTNGTASYAITAGSIRNVMNNYGLYTASRETPSSSVIDNVNINPTNGGTPPTMIQAFGNVSLIVSASLPYPTPTVYLYAVNRETGNSAVLDSSKINLKIAETINTWGNPLSASIDIPFNLMSQKRLNGQFIVGVYSSDPILTIDYLNRPVQYSISSFSDVISVSDDFPARFTVIPDVTMSFSTSLVTGIVNDTLAGLWATGSQYVVRMDVSNRAINSVLFNWDLSNLQTFTCANDATLTALSYSFADSLQYLNCSNCSIAYIADLHETTASYLNFNGNLLTYLPRLSPSTSFLDFSNNPVNTLDPFFPLSLTELGAHDTSLFGLFPVMPDGIKTASLYNNAINTLQQPLPLSMSYLDIHATSIPTMSQAPVSLSYLDVSNALFNDTALENATFYILQNGLYSASFSGTFRMTGYGPPSSPTLISNLSMLAGPLYNWSVYTD